MIIPFTFTSAGDAVALRQKFCMMKQLMLSLLTAASLTCAAQTDNYIKEKETGHTYGIIKDLKAVPKSLNFLVMGDWGRHGEPNQKKVAEQMANAMVGLSGKFIIATGDNFYPKGVMSDRDPSWQSSFENVYWQHPLYNDWYVVLGNHDYGSNPDAQIAYSQVSARWHMPARYYSIKKEISGTASAEFFFIDSNPFQNDYYTDKEFAPRLRAADSAAQKKWLETSLANSTATWKFVVGHHPLFSAGKRKGKTSDMENAFGKLFDKYHVDAYFCGHEHQLEHNQPEGYRFHEFISGSASEATPVTSAPFAKFAAQDFGFLTASLTDKEMLIQFINGDGKIVYTTTVKKQ